MKKKEGRKPKENEIIVKFEGSEILERTATNFGTGAHVIIPKEYSGRKIKIIIGEENE
jgi:putative transposon-encoded protein